jgi:hypothetical protein
LTSSGAASATVSSTAGVSASSGAASVAGASAGASSAIGAAATSTLTSSTFTSSFLAGAAAEPIRSPTFLSHLASRSPLAASRNLARAEIGAFIEPSNFARRTSRDGRFANLVAQAASITFPSK